MASFYNEMNEEHVAFIKEQLVFFTGSAADTGRINVSPKGMDSLRVFSSTQVGYLDATGSASETSAHMLQNPRLTFMFCSFGVEPLILRLYGKGRAVALDGDEGRSLAPSFTDEQGELIPGARQIILLDVDSVQTSCGYAVPTYADGQERQQLKKWAKAKIRMDALDEYHREKNSVSIDGFPTGLFEDS